VEAFLNLGTRRIDQHKAAVALTPQKFSLPRDQRPSAVLEGRGAEKYLATPGIEPWTFATLLSSSRSPSFSSAFYEFTTSMFNTTRDVFKAVTMKNAFCLLGYDGAVRFL
jgi:hypothetical protein